MRRFRPSPLSAPARFLSSSEPALAADTAKKTTPQDIRNYALIFTACAFISFCTIDFDPTTKVLSVGDVVPYEDLSQVSLAMKKFVFQTFGIGTPPSSLTVVPLESQISSPHRPGINAKMAAMDQLDQFQSAGVIGEGQQLIAPQQEQTHLNANLHNRSV